MLIRKATHPRLGFEHGTPSEITPRATFEQRRDLLRLMASGVAGAALASWATRDGKSRHGRARQAAPAR